MPEKVPQELRTLVRSTLDLLGRAIVREFGRPTFKKVENVRSAFKASRSASLAQKIKVNKRLMVTFRKWTANDRFAVAHSFATSLELINACENAIRTVRLRKRDLQVGRRTKQRITFVLTAHPTESRSPHSIQIYSRITEQLIKNLEDPKAHPLTELEHLVALALKVPLAKNNSPTVKDEAQYIYSSLLKTEILDLLIEDSLVGPPLFLRTWVGGDKDGHPGVNHRVMLESLQLSRDRLLEVFSEKLSSIGGDLELVRTKSKSFENLWQSYNAIGRLLYQMGTIKRHDGKSVANLHQSFRKFEKQYLGFLQVTSKSIVDFKQLLVLFPGVVVPLELREDKELVKIANEGQAQPILEMMNQLRRISLGGEPAWYVRGMVVSMTESSDDILSAAKLMKRHLGNLKIPVVPLFENKTALDNSKEIVEELLSNKMISQSCKEHWGGKFEVMLGYSDSAKESGALCSRSMIARNLFSLEKTILRLGCEPVFFHGSGGSIARGGGSIEEQITWWPKSAKSLFKATIQGEMIYRSFATPEILQRQLQKIGLSTLVKTDPFVSKSNFKPIEDFSEKVGEKYRQLVSDDHFLSVVERATPYSYLDQLKIGSRPSKRKKQLNVSNLRAIPWVLCWTQTRALLPVWWGLGSSWAELSKREKSQLRGIYKKSSFFKSFIKLLSFTLAKVEPAVVLTYLSQSTLSKSEVLDVSEGFLQELKKTRAFVKDVTGNKKLLWYIPWLSESIQLRSTMIHPLNLMQIVAIEKKESNLLRETVTGVASGMLTTG